MLISGPLEDLGSQSDHFQGTTKASGMVPVPPFAQIAIGAGALASVGFVNFNMKNHLQIVVPFVLYKVILFNYRN